MTIKGLVMSDRPDEYTGKKGLIKQQIITVMDVSEAGERLGAIQAATVNAAELLGLSNIGVIQPGKFADIIAVEGDPLANIATMERVLFVMKGGTVIKNETVPGKIQ
jgi:imidazolonepropionase-like amidohydrolase